MSNCYEGDRAARKLRHRKRNSCVFSAVVITCFLIHFWTQKSVLPEGPKIQTTIADLTHPCLTYPHALVRCGVWSMEDVDTAREYDATLRAHYADIGILHLAILRSDEMDYASFRQGNQIVWTAQTVKVAAGELVLEDRAGNKVRGRCGNRLSPIPRTPSGFRL